MNDSLVSVGEICEFKYGESLPERSRRLGDIPVFGSNGRVGIHSTAITDGPAIIIGRKGSVGEVNYSPSPCWPIDTTYYIDRLCTNQDLKWLCYALRRLNLPQLNKATGVPGLNRNDAYSLRIRVPPLSEQRRIAAILDQADALRRKRAVVLNRLEDLQSALLARLLQSTSREPPSRQRLDQIADILVGFPFKSNDYASEAESIRLCRGANVLPNVIDWSDLACWPSRNIGYLEAYQLKERDIVIAMDRPWISSGFKVARISAADTPSLLVQRVARIRVVNRDLQAFVYALLRSATFRGHCRPTETTVPHISPNEIRSFIVDLPTKSALRQFASVDRATSKIKADAQLQLAQLERMSICLQHLAFGGDADRSMFTAAAERIAAQ